MKQTDKIWNVVEPSDGYDIWGIQYAILRFNNIIQKCENNVKVKRTCRESFMQVLLLECVQLSKSWNNLEQEFRSR